MLASNVALSGAGVELVGMDAREYALKHALEPLRAQYDYIFIDCPPSLELLTLNALCAADQVLIPVQCEYYALEGLSDLMVTLRAVKKRLNPHDLDLRGAAHHVRRPDEFLRPGRRRGAPPLPRQGVRRGHSAQRPVVRGTQPRHARVRLR